MLILAFLLMKITLWISAFSCIPHIQTDKCEDWYQRNSSPFRTLALRKVIKSSIDILANVRCLLALCSNSWLLISASGFYAVLVFAALRKCFRTVLFHFKLFREGISSHVLRNLSEQLFPFLRSCVPTADGFQCLIFMLQEQMTTFGI